MGCIDPSWRPELALNLERLGLAAQTVLGRGGLLENQEVNAPLDVADGRQMCRLLCHVPGHPGRAVPFTGCGSLP